MDTELWIAGCLACLAIGVLLGLADAYRSQRRLLAKLEK